MLFVVRCSILAAISIDSCTRASGVASLGHSVLLHSARSKKARSKCRFSFVKHADQALKVLKKRSAARGRLSRDEVARPLREAVGAES